MPSLFLRLKGWHAPAGRRTCEPRPLPQDGQIRPAAPVGAWNLGSRPTDRLAGQHEAASAESEVRPGPSALTLRHCYVTFGDGGVRSTIHSLPAEYEPKPNSNHRAT